MNKNNFYTQYPLVFPTGAPEHGFSCGKGWYTLLDALFFVIQRDLEKLPEAHFRIELIKEKFGTLRIYYEYENATEYIEQTIIQAEEMSANICETCGEYGRLRDTSHWIQVRCDDCEKEYIERKNTPLSKEAQTALDAGLKSAMESEPVYHGSFAQYADDDD
jgi:hypothetical protein